MGKYLIDPRRSEDGESTIDFRVEEAGVEGAKHFSITYPFEGSRDEAFLHVDPLSGVVPLDVVAWAIEFARTHL